MKALSFAVFLLAVPILNFAQEQIETDRPDQTESPATVPHRYLQAETGFMYEKVHNDAQNIYHPTLLWRYGITPHVEFRLQTDFTTESRVGRRISGLSPVAVGFKTSLIKSKGFIPDISFVGHLTLAELATADLQSTYVAPDFRFLFRHAFSDHFELSYNLGAEWNGETPDASALYTIAASYKAADHLSLFAEFYGYLNKYESADHRFDAGAMLLLNQNFSLDISAGAGLFELSPSYFVSGGFSYRLPLH